MYRRNVGKKTLKPLGVEVNVPRSYINGLLVDFLFIFGRSTLEIFIVCSSWKNTVKGLNVSETGSASRKRSRASRRATKTARGH